MADDPTKDVEKKPDDNVDDSGKKGDEVSKLEQFLDKLDGMADKFGQLEQKVNLIQQNMLSPDYLDKGDKGKTPKPKGDEMDKAKGFRDIQWNELTNEELVVELVTELNRVLKGTASVEKMDELVSTVEDLQTDLDVAQTIVAISGDEDCSIKEAHKKFWDLADAMEELSNKFPNISASDAYKIASGKASKPTKPEDKDKGTDRKETVRELAQELRGGGTKPGGTRDLDTKPPADTRSTVTKKYDELFEGK